MLGSSLQGELSHPQMRGSAGGQTALGRLRVLVGVPITRHDSRDVSAANRAKVNRRCFVNYDGAYLLVSQRNHRVD